MVGISAIVVSVMAFVGINAWKKELTGKATFEASKAMMSEAYKVIESYRWAVNPMTYPQESSDRLRIIIESEPVKQVLDEAYAREKRFQAVSQSYNKLAESDIEVRVILGVEATKRIEELLISIKAEIVNLSSAIYLYFYARKSEAESGIEFSDRTTKEKMLKIVYQSPDSSEIKNLNNLVSELDKELKTYLRVKR